MASISGSIRIPFHASRTGALALSFDNQLNLAGTHNSSTRFWRWDPFTRYMASPAYLSFPTPLLDVWVSVGSTTDAPGTEGE